MQEPPYLKHTQCKNVYLYMHNFMVPQRLPNVMRAWWVLGKASMQRLHYTSHEGVMDKACKVIHVLCGGEGVASIDLKAHQ